MILCDRRGSDYDICWTLLKLHAEMRTEKSNKCVESCRHNNKDVIIKRIGSHLRTYEGRSRQGYPTWLAKAKASSWVE